MYIIVRLFIKYNVYYIEKNTQHIAIHYYIITVILHYFISNSIIIPINTITVKYISNIHIVIRLYNYICSYHLYISILYLLLPLVLLNLFHSLLIFYFSNLLINLYIAITFITSFIAQIYF